MTQELKCKTCGRTGGKVEYDFDDNLYCHECFGSLLLQEAIDTEEVMCSSRKCAECGRGDAATLYEWSDKKYCEECIGSALVGEKLFNEEALELRPVLVSLWQGVRYWSGEMFTGLLAMLLGVATWGLALNALHEATKELTENATDDEICGRALQIFMDNWRKDQG